jgi:hypothetical protein
METLLFSKADFKSPYPELPESLDEDRIEPAMLRAQRRLRPLLGAPLYAELVRLVAAEQAAEILRSQAQSANPTATADELPALAPLPAPWAELRAQLLPALLNATMVHYLPFSQTTVTSHSFVRKAAKESEPVDSRTLAQQVSIYDGEALSYEADLQVWLRTNASRFAGFYALAGPCHVAPLTHTPSVVVQLIGPPAH